MYYEYIIKKQTNMKIRYLILILLCYLIALPEFYLFTKFFSNNHNIMGMRYALFAPLYVTLFAVFFMFIDYLLLIVIVFVDNIIISKIFIKHYKLAEKQINKLDKELEEHPFKYTFYSNCIGILKASVIVTILLILAALVAK